MTGIGDFIPKRRPVAPCIGWLAHNTKTCECYEGTRKQAFLASLYPRPFGKLLCAFGRHRWARDDVHYRRWCVECFHGVDAPPERPC
jgi:hypothetical protein